MNKFQLKGSKRQVEEGNFITKGIYTDKGFTPIETIKLSKYNMGYLIKTGVLIPIEIDPISKEEVDTSINIESAVTHLANRIKWNVGNLNKYLYNLNIIDSFIPFSIILKEIAIMMDKKYPNHIRESKEIWSIDSINGNIIKISDITKIKSFKNFAAFRTLEEAKYAKDLLKETIKELFSNGK